MSENESWLSAGVMAISSAHLHGGNGAGWRMKSLLMAYQP